MDLNLALTSIVGDREAVEYKNGERCKMRSINTFNATLKFHLCTLIFQEVQTEARFREKMMCCSKMGIYYARSTIKYIKINEWNKISEDGRAKPQYPYFFQNKYLISHISLF